MMNSNSLYSPTSVGDANDGSGGRQSGFMESFMVYMPMQRGVLMNVRGVGQND